MTDSDSILFVVSHPDASAYLVGLGLAATRFGVRFSVFFTGDGVLALSKNEDELAAITSAAVEAIVCEHAWNSRVSEAACPVNKGSQTDHSRMIGAHNRVVSL